MNYELLFDKAKQAGISALEVYESTPKTLKISIYEQEIDNYTSSACLGISIRGIYKEKLGTTFIEIDDDSYIDEIIKQIIDNASVITADEEILFYDKKDNYVELPLYNQTLEDINIDEVISTLKNIENEVLAFDERIIKVGEVDFIRETSNVRIKNSFGLDIYRKSNIAYIIVECIAKENDDTQSSFDLKVFKDIKDFDQDKLVRSIGEEVCSKLNASKIPSNKYPTLIKNKAMADFLGALADSFSAENVQKGISVFEGKLNTTIFSNNITIVDDPHMVTGLNSTPFDDEGVPTFVKKVVEKGVLKTFLHNLKTAKADNVEPTGNGFKHSYSSGVNILPTNFYIEPETNNYDDMIKSIDKGVIITEVSGLHAGLNTLTLDFSLQASGFYVESGKIVKPINLITVAGNIQAMLNDIKMLGADLDFSPSGVGAPSILFNGLQITGD